ncbi:hypothetical protein ACOSQ2_004081 [Xanthoceras sorbifolium]
MGAVIDCVFELPSILKLASCSTRNLEFKCSLLLVTNLRSFGSKGDVSHARLRSTYSDAAVSKSETMCLHLMLPCSRGGVELHVLMDLA